MRFFGGKERKTQVKDPVCGMTVDPKAAAGTETHDGTTFYFCSQRCVEVFREDPHKYAH